MLSRFHLRRWEEASGGRQRRHYLDRTRRVQGKTWRRDCGVVATGRTEEQDFIWGLGMYALLFFFPPVAVPPFRNRENSGPSQRRCHLICSAATGSRSWCAAASSVTPSSSRSRNLFPDRRASARLQFSGKAGGGGAAVKANVNAGTTANKFLLQQAESARALLQQKQRNGGKMGFSM